MTSSYIYYVYAYLRADGTPYYIGKGNGGRYKSKNHPGIFLPPIDRIVFLEKNLSEVGALALERRYISWYGRKNNSTGILYNRTDGGDGSTNMYVTEETRNLQKKAKDPYRKIRLRMFDLTKTFFETDTSWVEHLEQGWVPYTHPVDVGYTKSLANAKVSAKLTGIDRGEYVMTEAREVALKARVQAATEAKLGSRAYNNGEIEVRSKTHPGEGWVVGGLKRQRSKKV